MTIEHPCPKCASTNTSPNCDSDGRTGGWQCNDCDFVGPEPDFKPLTFTFGVDSERMLRSAFIDVLVHQGQIKKPNAVAVARRAREMVVEVKVLAKAKGWIV